MGEGEECVELKFRIYDGTDICHGTYASSTTVATLKQQLVAEWPQDQGRDAEAEFMCMYYPLKWGEGFVASMSEPAYKRFYDPAF
ncbi:hypothetical protein AB3S75_026065 [Citrus x aurantiifolia]